jgi:accessory gene regulator B
MFARSTKRIIHWLCRKKIIKQQDMDVYAYGIQNLLIFLFNLFSFMVIGAIFHTIMYTAVFILFYSVLRIYAGGYHASTAMRCYFISNIIVLIFIIAFVNKKLSHLANKKVSQL